MKHIFYYEYVYTEKKTVSVKLMVYVEYKILYYIIVYDLNDYMVIEN